MTGGGMRFRVLGGLEWLSHGGSLRIGRRRERLLLGLLLLDIGRVVPAHRLIDLLWDEGHPPTSARGSLQVHVSRLRGRFLEEGAEQHGFALLKGSDGYMVDGDPCAVDLHRFRTSLQRAERTDSHAERLRVLELALADWGGPVLAGTASDGLVRRLGTGFDESYLSAITQRAEARLALGQRELVLEELARATAEHPLHERLAMLRMIALYRADHRGEALEVYSETRARLAEDLGLDPGADLRRVQNMILHADPRLLDDAVVPGTERGRAPAGRRPGAVHGLRHDRDLWPEPEWPESDRPVSATRPRPDPRPESEQPPDPGRTSPAARAGAGTGTATDRGAQGGGTSGARDTLLSVSASPKGVPGPVPGRPEAESVQRQSRTGAFIGRAQELEQLTALAAEARGGSGVLMIVGPAGSGKTALALQWCRGSEDAFGDGQLFLDLRGHSHETPMKPGEALSGLLRALGVPYQDIPRDPADMAELYQRTLADRRVLIVLDNAESADQVRQLLPYDSGCLALVTSRNRLGSLIVSHGASMLPLRPLASGDAEDLVRSVVGARRSLAEPEALADLVAICGRSPLSLRIAAANLALHPDSRIADHVRELRSGNPLESLTVAGDPDSAVRRAFELSYRRLEPEERDAFRTLGLLPGPATTVAAVAALLGRSVASAVHVLDRLFAEHLVERVGQDRLRLHDLIWWYARLLADAAEPAPAHRDARRRLLSWYADSADDAARCLYPQILRLDVEPVDAQARPARFDDPQVAADWFDAEHTHLVRLIVTESEAQQQAGQPAGAEPRPEERAGEPAGERAGTRAEGQRPEGGADGAGAASGARSAPVSCTTSGPGPVSPPGPENGTGGEPNPTVWILADTLRGYYWLRHNTDNWTTVASVALRAAHHAGDFRGQAAAHQSLGLVSFTMGDLERSRSHFQQAIQLARRAGWGACESVALSNLGGVSSDLGLLSEAAEYYDRAIRLDRRLRRTPSQTLLGLGEVLHGMGRLREAERLCRRALALSHQLSAPDSISQVSCTLATISLDLGELVEAQDLATTARRGFEAIGNLAGEAQVHSVIAMIGAEAGDGHGALRAALSACRLSRRSGRPHLGLDAMIAMGHARYQLGQYERAFEHFRIARRTAEEIGHLKGRIMALLGLGVCAVRGRRPLEGLCYAADALTLAQESQLRLQEGRSQAVIALAQAACGDPEAAERAGRLAEDIYADTGYRPLHSPFGRPMEGLHPADGYVELSLP
ncbi:BTAD domain-containing putative transcriptional regulator [Streptomyces sp. NPDC004609]|uniref:AfsR/SARP family transcriptional regulator n=1 Tax=Streptomyces sp. NPDC004609 TaxID=3364704 RepID=UPI0036974A7A